VQFLRRYLIPRLVQFVLVLFLGITAVFFIPRFAPSDPVRATIVALQSRGAYLDPATLEQTMQTMRELYGLEGTWLQQYGAFWRHVVHGDFGVSFYQFPVSVLDLIKVSLPWTAGLLLVTTLLAWLLGNVIGGIAGFYSRATWSKTVDVIAMFIRPLPYYIFAFALMLIMAFLLGWFPIGGGASLGHLPSLTWAYVADVLNHAFLPALSLVLLGGAAWFQTMKLIVQNVNSESYVQYAKMGGVVESRIVGRYVIRNAMLPQLTALALQLGQILSGALITEIVFSYPGVGSLLYHAIVTGDYNLIMGIISLSIVAISALILTLDLLYPLLDPRVRLT
jgi:peptide/nickel transport system permease protein